MQSSNRFFVKVSPISLSIAVLLSTPMTGALVLAQTSVLEEVIVTARKREESLQETPVAVSALNGAQLEDAGIYNLTDLSRVVPNLTANVGSGGGSAQLFIRGVGARNTGANFDGGVALYQDGVYVSRPDGNILESIDIQNVQVLRGPQGTLFGKNSTGGAILYATNKPAEEYEGHVEVTAGNYDRLDGQVTVNVPLVEDFLFSRLSLYSTERDGLMEDQFGREFSDIDRWGGQFQLRALAGDSVVIDVNGQYSETDQNARGQKCRLGLGVPGTGWQAVAQNSFIVVPSTDLTIQEHCEQSNALDSDDFLSALTGTIPPDTKAETTSVSATADWEINDVLSFKSISAYRNVEAGQQDDVYYAGIPLVLRLNYGYPIAEPRDTDWYSQEFQFTGTAFDDSLNYVVGLFASNEQTDKGTAVGAQGPFFGALFNPNRAFYTAEATELLTDNTSYAAFSQVEWAFTESWNLTLGLRYTWEERELERNTYDADPATLSTGAPAAAADDDGRFWDFPDGPDSFNPQHLHIPASSRKTRIDNDDWNPMGSIQYLFEDIGAIDTGSTYFTISTGFLSGGLSESLDPLTGEIPEYEPEEVVNYELGMKFDAFDSTLRVNTALFYTDYQNRQLTTIGINPSTGSIASKTINAKESTIAGFELETTWLPLDNLELTFNFAYNDGDIDEFDDTTIVTSGETDLQGCVEGIDVGGGTAFVDLCPVDRSNEDLPNLPKQIYYLAGQYTWDTRFGEVIARVDGSYSEDINTCFDYSSCLWRDGKGLEVDAYSVGARLTWLSPDLDWRVTAWGENLTDHDYKAGGNPLIGTTQTMSYDWNVPRTYGLEVAYTW
jgi:iron complex outermembrane receptor protein